MRNITLAAAMLAALTAGAAKADGVLSFFISGDTFQQPFNITNASTAGETVVGFGLNLSPIPYVFDTVSGGIPNNSAGVAFAASGGTGATTGLIGSPVFADGTQLIALTFNDFNVGETFSWDIDVDPSDPNASPTVFGNSLIGATAYVDFSNGLRALGVLEARPGDPLGSQFTVRSVVPTPGVPEPATWAMLIVGFGMVGFAARRRAGIRHANA